MSKVAYWCHITFNTFLFYGFSFFILYETACTGIRLLRTNLILSICMYQPAWTVSCYSTLKCKIYRLMCKIYRLTFKFYKLKSKIYALNCNINEKKIKKYPILLPVYNIYKQLGEKHTRKKIMEL